MLMSIKPQAECNHFSTNICKQEHLQTPLATYLLTFCSPCTALLDSPSRWDALVAVTAVLAASWHTGLGCQIHLRSATAFVSMLGASCWSHTDHSEAWSHKTLCEICAGSCVSGIPCGQPCRKSLFLASVYQGTTVILLYWELKCVTESLPSSHR